MQKRNTLVNAKRYWVCDADQMSLVNFEALNFGFKFWILNFCLLLCLTGCGRRAPKDDEDQMVLHLSLPTKAQTLDSGNMRDVYGMMVAGNIYETLYKYHYLKRPYEVIPVLAADFPT